MTLKYGQIPVEDLPKADLERLGIKLPPAIAEVGASLLVLGKVFNALKGLEDDEALQILQQAQMYVISRRNGTSIEDTDIPGDKLSESYAPPIDWVLQVTAKIFKFKPADLKQRKRDADVALARQVAMYVLSMTNKYTLTQIGLSIGGRSPATVSHAFIRIGDRINKDEALGEKVRAIQKIVGGKHGK